MSTSHEDQYKFLIISHLVLLRIRSISDKSCVENKNIHLIFNFFFNCAVYEIMWKNIAQTGTPQMTI